MEKYPILRGPLSCISSIRKVKVNLDELSTAFEIRVMAADNYLAGILIDRLQDWDGKRASCLIHTFGLKCE